ncbi:MAG TPA: PadR family transcriptional regulator [Candidatus Deferrimicrobiaceae bacterium]|nr:PadR family transcriptional regulator [Candidatus Deferrimicrobiaceae bacterium]
MQTHSPEITGTLQAKIMMLLREEQLCGVDLMKRLKIKSPGTIYPVLDVLKTKGLIDFKVETNGAARKKIYFLTGIGVQKTHDHLTSSVKFCCDTSEHVNKILGTMNGLIEINRKEKVLSTLDNDELKRFLKGAEVTYSSDLQVSPNTFDKALSFLGVGCLIGNETSDIANYVNQLYLSLKKGGILLAIETEKTDSMFSQILFEDVFGLKEPPGLHANGLRDVLEKTGFINVSITAKMGLLYAVAQKCGD